jgi:hypothetical protein
MAPDEMKHESWEVIWQVYENKCSYISNNGSNMPGATGKEHEIPVKIPQPKLKYKINTIY